MPKTKHRRKGRNRREKQPSKRRPKLLVDPFSEKDPLIEVPGPFIPEYEQVEIRKHLTYVKAAIDHIKMRLTTYGVCVIDDLNILINFWNKPWVKRGRNESLEGRIAELAEKLGAEVIWTAPGSLKFVRKKELIIVNP